MTATQKHGIISVCTPILSADQQPKEDIMLDQQKITIIYCRLSVEDIKEDSKGGKADESNSIQNQKEYLTRYAKDHGYTNLKIFVNNRCKVTYDQQGFIFLFTVSNKRNNTFFRHHTVDPLKSIRMIIKSI